MTELRNNLYDSLCKVFKKLENCNFIQMTWFGMGDMTSDDLKAFNDYFELEPRRQVWGDWDMLFFEKNGKRLDSTDYAEMKKQIDLKIDELTSQKVKQSPKIKTKLKYEDYGWLSPDGEFYASDWGTHQTKATEILDENNWTSEAWKMQQSEERLTDADYLSKYKNFVLIHSASQGIPYPTILEGKRLTKKQREFLYDFYMERNYVSLANKYFNY